MASSNAGGYEHEFLEPSAKLKEFECPLCLFVTREPHLTVCCGQHFCQACINRIVTDRKPCPLCKTSSFVVFLDKKQKRRVLELKVECTWKERGCDWSGELGKLDTHVDTQNGSCQFVDVNCPNNCGESHQRYHLANHLSDLCPKRPFTCKYCQFKAAYEQVCNDHYPKCVKYPVPCPNNCEIGIIERGNLAQHVSECPLQVVECEFAHAGCSEKITRTDLPKHMERSMQKHLVLLSSYCVKEMTSVREELAEKDKQVEVLRSRVRTLEVVNGLLPIEKAKEAESQSLLHEVDALKRELGDQTRELIAKIERVQELQREKDEFKGICNKERHEFEMLLQQVAAQRESCDIKKAEGDLQHQVLFPQTQMNTASSVPSGSIGYKVNMPPRLQTRGQGGDMQMREGTYRGNLGPTSIAPSTQTANIMMQIPGQPMQIGGLLQQHQVISPQQHLTLLQTPQAGLRQTMIPHQALHGHQGGLLPLHQMPPTFPGTAFRFSPTNQPHQALHGHQGGLLPLHQMPPTFPGTAFRFSPTNQPVNLQTPAMQVQPPTSQQPSYVPPTTNNRTQYQPRTRPPIPIIDPNTRAQVSVDTEPPPVPSSGAHVDSSDSSSGVGGGGGAPHHPVVAEDFKQRVQEAVHEAPSVHLTEESAPSDTQAESQTETESGSLEPKLETGSDVMELRPEPVPTSEHKNKLEEEEEDVKGVEETVTEPEMTVPETKDDSQEAEGDAAAPTPSQTPLIPPPSLYHGRTTYPREFILQFKAMEVCKQPPKELESTDCFKPFAFRDQPPMDVFLPFGGGGGKSDKRREPKKIITQPQRVEKLEFLESGGGSSQPSQEPAYLKDLITLFGDTDTTNDDIFDWIEQNCPAEVHNTPPFVRVLTTAAVQGTCSGSGTSARFEEEKFYRKLILLKKYVRETEELQLHVLYALQVAIAKLQHPPGVLNSMFNIVYDLDLVGEKVYTQWKDKGTETFGKGVALQAVTSFFEWLKCAEQESDEEGGGWNT